MAKKYLYIDGWFLKPPLRGVGRYINNIIVSLPKPHDDIEYFLLIPSNDIEVGYFPSFVQPLIFRSFIFYVNNFYIYSFNIWSYATNIYMK